MTDSIKTAPNSPCISVCVVNPSGVCLGCGRTIDEVSTWASANAEQQHQIVEDAATRLKAINQALFSGDNGQ